MIVCDLDGTLLNGNRKISTSTKKYLNQLKNRGYIIVIATGRIYASALKCIDESDFTSYIISDTGGCIYEAKTGKAISKNIISTEIVEKFFKYYSDDCHYIDFCDKNIIYKYSDEEEKSSLIRMTKDKNYVIKNCKETSHISISMKDNESAIKLYDQLLLDIPELDIIVMQDSFVERKWIEAFPKGCSKFNAIAELANYLNIKNEEIIAFGDGLNDIEMLEKCGYGVALKNALPEVKKVADDVTQFDYNNDGVINYLGGHLDVK